MVDDFADHPKSVTEIRSARSDRACDWTPRDVLIDVLRAIDEKRIDPDALVVVMRATSETEGAVSHISFRISSPDYHTTLGLLTSTIYRVQERA